MVNKPKTPHEVANRKPVKETYSFTLSPQNIKIMNDMAKRSGASLSALVDAAIEFYIEAVEDKK